MTDTITAAHELAARASESFALVTRQHEDDLEVLTARIEAGDAGDAEMVEWNQLNQAINARLPIQWKLQAAAQSLFEARNAATLAKVEVR